MYSLYNKAEVSFRYIKEIGQEGKNSQAFLAHDENLDAELVIKVIPKAHSANADDFFNESRSLYRASHPHVVQIQYACACEDNIYLALPFYKNGSLKSYAEKNNLSIREIVRYSIQIAAGLHNVHSKGLIHFDIKPDNILLSDRNEALVSDFGLAKLINEDDLATPMGMYVKHMAPEWFTDKEFTSQYDIYQLGLTLYRLVVGDEQFHDQLSAFTSLDELEVAVCDGTFPARITLEHIPSRLGKIISKCLQVDLKARYKSVLEVSNDLSKIDDNLIDWRYEVVDGKRRWTKVTSTHEYLLEVGEDGTAVGQKRKGEGRWSKITDACGKLTSAKIKKFLGDH